MKSSLAVLLAAILVLLAGPARAQAGYVPIIDSTLGVTVESAEPTQGCQLCHTDPAGGTTSLRPFGQMMVSKYGLISTAVETAGADASLRSALQAMAADNPQIVMDLQKGADPNPDVVNDPVPQYGCSAAPGASDRRSAIAVGLGLLAAAALRRARHRRQASPLATP